MCTSLRSMHASHLSAVLLSHVLRAGSREKTAALEGLTVWSRIRLGQNLSPSTMCDVQHLGLRAAAMAYLRSAHKRASSSG